MRSSKTNWFLSAWSQGSATDLLEHLDFSKFTKRYKFALRIANFGSWPDCPLKGWIRLASFRSIYRVLDRSSCRQKTKGEDPDQRFRLTTRDRRRVSSINQTKFKFQPLFRWNSSFRESIFRWRSRESREENLVKRILRSQISLSANRRDCFQLNVWCLSEVQTIIWIANFATRWVNMSFPHHPITVDYGSRTN